MAVYEFNPNPYIDDYIPYLDGMTEEEFKNLILDVKELFVKSTSKIISQRLDWSFLARGYSIDTLYNNLIPFLLMNNLTRVFKYTGQDGLIQNELIYEIIIVFNRKDKKESTMDIAEKILRQYDYFIENSGLLFEKEVKDIAENLEEFHW